MKPADLGLKSLMILLIWLAGLSSPAQAQTAQQEIVYQEDFEDGLAQGWDREKGWELIQDDGNWVLAGQGHVWASPNVGYDDYFLSFRVKVLSGNILFNYRTYQAQRYFIDFQSESSTLNKQIGEGIFQDALVSRDKHHALNEWHQVEISGQGAVIQLVVDGVIEWTYTDPDPFVAGNFSFESIGESIVYIDDISVALAETSAYLPSKNIGSESSLSWVRTGGPPGGIGYDVRLQPDNPDWMLVTDANAGVFISRDGGKSWALANDGITTRTGPTGDITPIFCLTIDPSDPAIVWAGTQDELGIYKSIDGGQTWEKRDQGILEGQGITFRGFSVDPTNSDIVYAAAEISSYVWNNGEPRKGREFDLTRGVVYKTTDGGLSWKPVWYGDNLARYVWLDPRDTNILYVSTGIFDREAANSDPLAGNPGGEGILKSTDGGKTWVHINNGLNNLYVGSLFMHPENPDILLAGTGNNQYYTAAGVYLSVDGGAAWKQVISGENISAVEFSTSNPEIAYAAGINSVFRSMDAGQTWERIAGGGECSWGPPGVCAGFPIDLQVDPRDPDRLFVNSYGGGNFVSMDGGRTWKDTSRGYTGALVRAIAVDPADPARTIAAARSGLFLSQDGGTSWQGLNDPPITYMDWNVIAIDPSNPRHMLASSNWNHGLELSLDGGENWVNSIALGEANIGFRTVALAPSNPGIVYAGTAGYYSAGAFDPAVDGRGIFISIDGGKTWAAANDASSADASVTSLAVDPGHAEIVYAATLNKGLLKTTDSGKSWQKVTNGLPGDSALSVAINPLDAKFILAGFNRKSLFMSVDGGVTWEQSVRGMMAESSISSIVFDPADPQHNIYVSDWTNGVYRTSDAGKTWTLIKTGLTNRSINALAITADGLHLYAASEGGGVFRLDLNAEAPLPLLLSTPVQSVEATKQVDRPQVATPLAPAATAVPSGDTKPAGGLPCGSALILPAFATGLLIYRQRRPR